jgi:hypothetical protein
MSLCDVRDGPAVDLQIESEIPSEVRCSVHGQAARLEMMIRPKVIRGRTALRNSADKNCAQESKHRNDDIGEAGSCFHDIDCTHELDFRQQIAPESVANRSKYSTESSARCQPYENRKDKIYIVPLVKSAF